MANLQNSSLRVVSVGFANIDAAQLASVIRTTPVRMLHLNNCTIENIDGLNDAPSDTLTSIYLRDTDLGSLDASWIDQYPSLRHFQVLDCTWANDQEFPQERKEQLDYFYIGTTRSP